MPSMKVLFLYKRLASYLMVCVEELSRQVDEVHIVYLPPDKNAPFNFTFPRNVKVHQRAGFTAHSLLAFTGALQPDIVLCSGWRDYGYMKTCRNFTGKIPTVLLMDNQWRNRWRQKFFCLFSRWYLHPSYSHVWVPGSPQNIYANRLGYTDQQIKKGLFCADSGYFSAFSEQRTGEGVFPKRFLFIGRYVNHKGLDILIKAFQRLGTNTPSGWELWCVGQGPLLKSYKDIPRVKHFGFAQPSELGKIIRDCGVFVIPSRFEPWGVVLQEMIAAGFPVIASSEVGAARDYIDNQVNGLIFNNDDAEDLYLKMEQVVHMNDEDLRRMAQHSIQKALPQTPQRWVFTLLELIEEFRAVKC